MSFSFSFTAVVRDDIGEALQTAITKQLDQAKEYNYEANVVNAVNQGWLDAVESYLTTLVGKVARPGDTVNISISGHANPSTEPLSGWASNMITVSINQVYKETE